MSVFGVLADSGAESLATVTDTAPAHPGKTKHIDEFENLVPSAKSRRQSVEPQADFNAWLALAGRIADEERARAERRPQSVTLLVRWAQSAKQAGRELEAQEAALRVLERSAELARSDAQISMSSVRFAARTLVGSNVRPSAEKLLSQLPPTAGLNYLRAAIAAEDGRGDECLQLLGDAQDAESCDLRGYVLLCQDRNQEALAQLRKAQRLGGRSVDTTMNVAIAFKKLGSQKKAIRSAREASRLAPGRQDVSYLLLDLLIEAREFESAVMEIRHIKKRGVVEPVEFIVRQAQVSLGRGDRKRSIALLRRALEAARVEGDTYSAAEISGNIAVLEFNAGQLPRSVAAARVRDAMRAAAHSIPLATALADLQDSVVGAVEVRRIVEGIRQSGGSPERLLPLEARLAFLECDFVRASALSARWCQENSADEHAASIAVYLHGQVTEDWQGAAELAKRSLVSLKDPGQFANNAAYALALGGEAAVARRVVQSISDRDFVVEATTGLVELALGNVQAGLKRYRRAAEMADSVKDEVSRVMMTIHQAMALRRLLTTSQLTASEVRAASLPPVQLPTGWEQNPSFRLLQWVANKNGWGWPVVID